MGKKNNSERRSRDKKIEDPDDDDDDDDDDDSLNEEKRLLRVQINDLETLISEIEFSLNQPTFSAITNPEVLSPPAVDHKRSYKLKNLGYILQHELNKFSGLYCTKFTRHEYIFNFSPFSKTKSDSLYTVQFSTASGKGTMGKYIMPSSGVMENIIVETPIDKLAGLIPFFRNCKRHLDCYVNRKEQYEKLKELTTSVNNFRLDTDSSYVLITCDFLQVYRKSSDNLLDIRVHLCYDYGKVKPSTVNVDWSMKKKPSDEDLKEMRTFMKIFKSLTLSESYKHIENSNKIFSWQPTKVNPDEILDLDLSEEEEEEEESRPSRKRPRKRERSPSSGSNRTMENPSEEPEGVNEGQKKPETKRRRGKSKANQTVPHPSESNFYEPERPLEKMENKPARKKRGPKPKPKPDIQQKENSPDKLRFQKKSPGSFRQPKTRQSTLNFSRVPKDPDATTPNTKNPISRTISSTPMPKPRGNPQISTPGGLSPIVAEENTKKLGKLPNSKHIETRWKRTTNK